MAAITDKGALSAMLRARSRVSRTTSCLVTRSTKPMAKASAALNTYLSCQQLAVGIAADDLHFIFQFHLTLMTFLKMKSDCATARCGRKDSNCLAAQTRWMNHSNRFEQPKICERGVRAWTLEH